MTRPIGIFSSLGLLVIEYGSVVRRNDIVHVGHIPVAYLKVVHMDLLPRGVANDSGLGGGGVIQ